MPVIYNDVSESVSPLRSFQEGILYLAVKGEPVLCQFFLETSVY